VESILVANKGCFGYVVDTSHYGIDKRQFQIEDSKAQNKTKYILVFL